MLYHFILVAKMDKIIKDIHIKSDTKLLLFGGVYSNLQALEALKTVADSLHIAPQHCISTGDLVGYCAQPEESIQFFKNWGALSIRGNVETQLINEEDHCGCDFTEGSRCDSFSAIWYPYAQQQISKASLEFLKTFPNHYQIYIGSKKATVLHGSYTNESEFIFKSTDWNVKKENFNITKSDVIISGHCGLPFIELEDNKTWINPGVIGMPANDGNTSVYYAVMSFENNQLILEHHRLNYNHQLASNLMEQNNLPSAYSKTLTTGIWDNMDILPTEETEQQEQEINLDSLNLAF